MFDKVYIYFQDVISYLNDEETTYYFDVYNHREGKEIRPCVSIKFVFASDETPDYPEFLETIKDKFITFFLDYLCNQENISRENKEEIVYSQRFTSENIEAIFSSITKFGKEYRRLGVFKVSFFFDWGFKDVELRELNELFSYVDSSYYAGECFEKQYFDRLKEVSND